MKIRFALGLLVLMFMPLWASAESGVLFLSPERGSYTIDDEFTVEVRADTGEDSAFAAEADLSFNPQALAVERISSDNSVLALWPTQPEFSNTKGTIRFSGTANTAFSGKNAKLIAITFRAIGVAPGDIHFDSGAILKNDSRAMNIITAMRSGLYTISPRGVAPAAREPVVATTTPTETPEVKGAAIQVPQITGYDDRVTQGDRIVLRGSGTPDTKITVYLQRNDETPVESAILTAHDGSFTYASAEKAERGIYRAWAEARSSSETFSSDKVVVTVGSDDFAAAAETFGPVLMYALPFLVLLILAGLSLGYWYNRRAAQR